VIVARGEPLIVLYEHPGFGGRSLEVTSRTWSDSVVRVSARAPWLFTAAPGACAAQSCSAASAVTSSPGRYDDLGPLNGRVNSAELLTVPRAPVGIAIPPAPTGRVVLYEFSDFRGRSVVSIGPPFPISNGWASTIGQRRCVSRTGTGCFCTDVRFQGDCRTLGPGEYRRLPPSVDRRIVSARRVNDVYGAAPSAQPYVHWQPMS
jgi:hypothetical protein